ncbi:MAG TPA: energy transducer TonB [Vicinamibacterales bacterium]|nr:energy transducer TonB [Vicinamibacterales bacterium]
MALWVALAAAFCPAPSAMAQARRPVVDQDPLTRAKDLYASANFEDALQILESLNGPAASTEAAAYQVYCLFALARYDDARAVVDRLVRADPMFHPPAGQVAPRVRAFFDSARKPVLIEVARQSFAAGRSAFKAKDMTAAAAGFDRVLTLLGEIGAEPSLADFRTVTEAFRDLARLAAAPASKPDGRPQTASAAAPNTIAPVRVSVPLPEWRPTIFELNRTFTGQVELVIDEEGKVLTASMLTGVHPRYDPILLEAAKDWIFKPATRNGVAIPYRYVMTVQVLR